MNFARNISKKPIAAADLQLRIQAPGTQLTLAATAVSPAAAVSVARLASGVGWVCGLCGAATLNDSVLPAS